MRFGQRSNGIQLEILTPAMYIVHVQPLYMYIGVWGSKGNVASPESPPPAAVSGGRMPAAGSGPLLLPQVASELQSGPNHLRPTAIYKTEYMHITY
jgi:hypothetical protein